MVTTVLVDGINKAASANTEPVLGERCCNTGKAEAKPELSAPKVWRVRRPYG